MDVQLNRGEIYRISEFYVEWKVKDFIGVTRSLQVIADGICDDGYIDLYLCNLHSEDNSVYSICCCLGIKGKCGDVYKSVEMCKPFHVEFPAQKILHHVEFRNVLDADGHITFFCEVWVPRDEILEAASNTPSRNELSALEDFKNLLLSGEHSDVIFNVKGEQILAHLQILAARCKEFHSKCILDMEENSGVVNVVDFEPAAFREFVNFLYSGRTDKMSSGNVLDLYCIADKYAVRDLKTECSRFMKDKMRVESFCSVIITAIKYEDDELIQIATDFFLREGKKIIETDEWLSFTKGFPSQSVALVAELVNYLSH